MIVVRAPRVTDGITSRERKLTVCRELCDARGFEVVGVAEDLDISAGKTAPFGRPQLGKWLADPTRYDVIVFFRVDRIVLRLFDLADHESVGSGARHSFAKSDVAKIKKAFTAWKSADGKAKAERKADKLTASEAEAPKAE